MQVSVSGKQIDIGSSLQEHVKDRLVKGVTKYFDRALNADVVFSKASHTHSRLYRADIFVNEGTGTGVIIKSNGESDDIYTSFDTALARVEKQLRRYKRRIKNHQKPKMSEAIAFEDSKPLKGTKYVLSPFSGAEEEESDNDNPVIVAEKTNAIETLSVSEAVMRMDLAQLPALLFRNRGTGRLNVVYHRADGNIAWVDPASDA